MSARLFLGGGPELFKAIFAALNYLLNGGHIVELSLNPVIEVDVGVAELGGRLGL
jgi:hypothetical protein